MASEGNAQIVRVKTLFAELRDAADASRCESLLRVERDDPTVARLVRDLLDAHDTDDRFTTPIVALDDLLPETPRDDATGLPDLGERYRATRLIGCGAVGDVYLAEETGPVAREVAVKVFRPHRLDSGRRRRFAIEARALAALSHEGIARVHGSGETADGRPYLVMEHVRGRPIDEVCEGLDHRAVLWLVNDLCDAVQHAHNRGVIHRDLKPSNVLVSEIDDDRRVKVIDFGVAKLADEAGAGVGTLTLHGQLVGTLDCMSPEQWRGEPADTRSDVYALGVLLHRLVTGRLPRRPAAAAGSATASSVAGITMPEVPRSVRRDMETITATALAPSPDDRYASPRHLAEEIGRLLRGEPLAARRAGALERLVKLVRRRPLATAAVAAIALTFVMLGAMTVHSRHRLAVEVDVQREFIVEMLDSALDQLYRIGGTIDAREKIALSLLDRTERLLEFDPDDLALLEARARLTMELGNVAAERGPGAEAWHAEAADLFADVISRGADGLQTRRRHAEALARAGHATRWDRLDDRRARFEAARAIHRALALEYPDHPGVLDDLCWSEDRIGEESMRLGLLDDAFEEFDGRLTRAERLLRLDPHRRHSVVNLMVAHLRLAQYHDACGDQCRDADGTPIEMTSTRDASLRTHLDEALALGGQLVAADPDWLHCRMHVLQVLTLDARASIRRGDASVAAEAYSRLVAESGALVRQNPERRRLAIDSIRIDMEHAHAAVTFADESTARSLYRRVVRRLAAHRSALSERERSLMHELTARWGDADM